MSKTVLLVIDGNIGVGKSSILRHIKDKKTLQFMRACQPNVTEALEQLLRNVFIIEEPVSEFSTFKHFNPLCINYRNPRENAGLAQLHIMRTIFAHWEEQMTIADKMFGKEQWKLIVTERSPEAALLFLETYKKEGIHTAFAFAYLLNEWEKLMGNANWPDPKIVMLQQITADVDVCYDRIGCRDRAGEKDGLSKSFLNSLAEVYKMYFEKKKHTAMPPISNGGRDEPCSLAYEIIDRAIALLKANYPADFGGEPTI